MKRKLFCEISPLTYKISMEKCILLRNIKDLFSQENFANERQENKLPFAIYKHNSLIRRKLGNVNMELQENKAKNLSLAAPKINGIIINNCTYNFKQKIINNKLVNKYEKAD